ncbi:hypothetical protein GCM10010293_25860 [Streptomyces griseoflavus]|nr:hypothetical protein GCM10010293_25860 [Streptomyces griseoflavus]
MPPSGLLPTRYGGHTACPDLITSLPSVSPPPNQAITVRQLRTSSAHPPDGEHLRTATQRTGIRSDREGKYPCIRLSSHAGPPGLGGGTETSGHRRGGRT